jgi:hypothetical protein
MLDSPDISGFHLFHEGINFLYIPRVFVQLNIGFNIYVSNCGIGLSGEVKLKAFTRP